MPPPTRKRRAIHEDDKHERRQVMLDIAWKQFQKLPYDEVKIIGIAHKAGLAKGTVYLYFKTKEELFLALTEQKLGEWFAEVDARLEALSLKATIPDVVAILSAALRTRSDLTRLLAILSTLLERNVDFDVALRFKQGLLAQLTKTGTLLERALPFLPAGQGAHLLLRVQALVVGLRHLADPAPVLEKVFDQPGLAVLRVDFDSEFAETLTALLRGLQDEARS